MIYFPVRSRCSAAMSDDVERTNDNIDGRLQKNGPYHNWPSTIF